MSTEIIEGVMLRAGAQEAESLADDIAKFEKLHDLREQGNI